MDNFMPKGIKGFQRGHSVPEKIREKISQKMQNGNSGSFKEGHKINLGKKFSKERYPNKSGRKHTEKEKEKIRKANLGKHSGEKNPNWKGGITPLRSRIYASSEYKRWRTLVFERDNYTCQECSKIGGRLNADHIKPFSLFPELRFVVSNGRALCEECHKKTPTYGNFPIKKYMEML